MSRSQTSIVYSIINRSRSSNVDRSGNELVCVGLAGVGWGHVGGGAVVLIREVTRATSES